MPEIGQILSHYSITEKIGRGGMGEVYRAKDQKLGRDVAIKVLPEEFAKDADRVARFQREAKLLASLNHPNIAAIHGLEESAETQFLVMELIEGDTLAERIKRGPIPVEEALKLALQIAEALEAAHEKGVIHRDLKPANVKVSPDGKVKVLDFGLAKAFAGDQADLNLSNSPTLSNAATQQGLILGTAAYMPPEQARGKPVDKRADIWAFGAVLYEMLTGRVAFRGEDVSEILASVIKGDVKLDLLPANLHPRVREAITRCLQRDLNRRYQDIRDARYEMEQALADPDGVFAQPIAGAEHRNKLRTILPWIAAAFVLAAIVAGWAVWKPKPVEPKQVLRFEYYLPDAHKFYNLAGAPVIAVSRDGNLLAYSTPEGLYLRSMDDWTATLLAGTEGADWPFFSPDGEWIGYVSQGKLKKITIGGGSPVTLCDALEDGGFSWTADNRILQGSGENIMWVSADGGKLEPLFEEKGKILGVPQMLPDGKSVLFTAGAGPPHTVMVRSLESGESKELFEGGFARYIETGHIVYGVGHNLYARPFDLRTLEVTAGPVSVIEGVLNPSFFWSYAVSDSGTLIYVPGTATTAGLKRSLVWVDREGKEEPIAALPDEYRSLKISPDGTQVALSIYAGGNQDIHIWDMARERMMKLTFDTSDDVWPIWTPDGKSIVFASNRGDHGDRTGLYRRAADGTGEDKVLGRVSDPLLVPRSWSGDGEFLILYKGLLDSDDIGMLSMEGGGGITPLLHERYHEMTPSISPDGRWLAYVSNEGIRYEVYVRPFPDVDKGQWKVSTNGGSNPLWSRDGRELFYWGDNGLMAVAVETAPAFKAGSPKVILRRAPGTSFYMGHRYVPWDIHPDGKRFLMLKPAETSDRESAAEAPRKINIVVNWFEELKQKVPAP